VTTSFCRGLRLSLKVEGVPANRGGHGIPKKILIQELTSSGFQVVTEPADWPNNNYCVIFRKPEK